jgi:hypothetical protein
MVLSQYDTDSFVSIWYCHGTDSDNFNKPSMLTWPMQKLLDRLGCNTGMPWTMQ